MTLRKVSTSDAVLLMLLSAVVCVAVVKALHK